MKKIKLSKIIIFFATLLLAGAVFLFFWMNIWGKNVENSNVIESSQPEDQSSQNEALDTQNLETVSVQDELLDNNQTEEEKTDIAEVKTEIVQDEEQEKKESEAEEQAEQKKYSEKLTTPNIPISKDELKIGFVTDPHLISRVENGKRVFLEKYYERLDYFLRKMNDDFLPNLILINGDVIEGTGQPASVGMAELSMAKEFFNRTDIKKYWVIGNHDLRSVEKSQWKSVLGIDYLYEKFSVGDYDIFIVDSNFTAEDKNVKPGNGYTRGNVSKNQVKWLEKELEKSSKKKVVFIHHPPLRNVSEKDSSGLLKNAIELQEIFSKNDVIAVFSGHIENLYNKKIDGVEYFVFPGLVKHPKYPGTFVEITLNKKKLSVNMYYLKSENEIEYKKVKIQ